ncbi:MAG: 30S ribosomal protein S8 [Candidatus Absconditabacterales bacterium]
MSYTNAPVIDLLIQIKNAYLARKPHLEGITASAFKLKVLELLKKAKFVADFKVTAEGNKKSIEIDLLDSSNMNEVVPQIKLFSKPSRRYYVGYEEIKGVAGGKGIGLISTDKGLMFTHEAKLKKLGGELIAEIY